MTNHSRELPWVVENASSVEHGQHPADAVRVLAGLSTGDTVLFLPLLLAGCVKPIPDGSSHEGKRRRAVGDQCIGFTLPGSELQQVALDVILPVVLVALVGQVAT